MITGIDRIAQDFGDNCHLELADTAKYIVKEIIICINEEQ